MRHSRAPTRKSSTGEASTRAFDKVVPTLATAGVIAMSIAGAESFISSVLALAQSLIIMDPNEESLGTIQASLEAVFKIDAKALVGELSQRWLNLQRKLEAIDKECTSFGEKNPGALKRFLKGAKYKEKINGIKTRIETAIYEFTFHDQISIDKLVGDMTMTTTAPIAPAPQRRKSLLLLGPLRGAMDEAARLRADTLLQKLVTVAAQYDAEHTPGQCMEGTRVDIIRDLVLRLTAPPHSAHRIIMLAGSAGSGKSTLAKSIALKLAEKNKLAASFFFSRVFPERSGLTRLPSTLARQLASFDPNYEQLLVEVLDNCGDEILSSEPHLQFKRLVVDPLVRLSPSEATWVICLDAMDECGADHGQTLLRWLSASIDLIPSHVRFFLTGRPGMPSYAMFTPLVSRMHDIILDELDDSTVSSDIRIYLKHSLENDDSVKENDIEEMTRRAGGLFVFAATAVRYIKRSLPQRPAQESISRLLGKTSLTPLDTLYHLIVDDAIPHPDEANPRTLQLHFHAISILGAVINLMEPLGAQCLAALLDLSMADLRQTLLPLSAVVHVSEDDRGEIRIIHASFKQFMTSSIRNTRPDLLCGTDEQQSWLALKVFRIMRKELHFNICQLPTSYLRNSEIPNLATTLDSSVSGQLRYACRFWADHLQRISFDGELAKAVRAMLFHQFLFWLEAMSLLGLVSCAPRILSTVIAWATKHDISIERFANDGRRFIAFFAEPIIQSAPHIYLSALALAPTQSEVSRRFRSHFPKLLSVKRGCMTDWPAALATFEGHTDWVNDVAVWPDAKCIASCSHDKTIRLWDDESGEPLGDPLEGHTLGVNCVAFSPDGRYIVSGSLDRTVRLWDRENGQIIAPPGQGHSDSVQCVTFSPDGTQIISGSNDQTLRIWDAQTLLPLGDPLARHSDNVLAVACSNTLIASASADKSIILWNLQTREVSGLLEGHTDSVTCLTFSADGERLVSGSGDCNIRTWDVATRRPVDKPRIYPHSITSVAYSSQGNHVAASCGNNIHLWDARRVMHLERKLEGHTKPVNCVTFSGDGTRVISGSADHTIRIWNAESRSSIGGSFAGPRDQVTSVAVSPDGTRIASASGQIIELWDAETGQPVGSPLAETNHVWALVFSPDRRCLGSVTAHNTAHIWDVDSGDEMAKLEGHTNFVKSMSFTPDGTRVVTGSTDRTLRLWDAFTGVQLGDPLTGHTRMVASVAFSPDGASIVSGSADTTLRVWDAISGKLQDGPLEGHTTGVRSVAFALTGKLIASGSDDQTVRLWDAQTRAPITILKGHSDWVTSITFSPTGEFLASGSFDRTVRLWSVERGEEVACLDGHTACVQSVKFSPDGSLIFSGSDDRTVRGWDTQRIKLSQRAEDYRNPLIKALRDKPLSFLSWKLQHGWVYARPSELLLWLPSSHRNGFWSPYNSLMICKEQTQLGYEDFVCGEQWSSCYDPSLAVQE